MRDRCTVVLDVGKTHAKLSLWAVDGSLLARRARPNVRVKADGYRALDAAGIETWVAGVLTEFVTLGHVGTIIPVGHGAGAALIRDGRLVCAPFDYESPIPADFRRRYDADRDQFAFTGSPALPNGLNLGAQLAWMEESTPALRAQAVTIVPWAQYWAWVLSGVAAAEVTSLGCHTDLWRPASATPSTLAARRGWDKRLAPLRRADEILGPLRPEWVARTGLPADTQVLCGLHDSNAALLAARGYAAIADHDATVVSTGTWFIAMRSAGALDPAPRSPLPEGRDCLVNVDAYGMSMPSARFMGGRELELLNAAGGGRLDDRAEQSAIVGAIEEVVALGTMAFPTLAPGCGPYPHAQHSWSSAPRGRNAHRAATGLYAALVMQTCLSLIGARNAILIEGRFAEADVFVRALASLVTDATVYVSHAHNGVSYGALRLIDPSLAPPGVLRRVEPLPVDLKDYAAAWRRAAEATSPANSRLPVPESS